MSDEPHVGKKKRKLSDISRDLRKEEILEADGPLNLGNRHEVPVGERRTLSEESKDVLKRKVEQVENRLDEQYQRPIEMHKEAERIIKKLPPWPAIVCAIFGLLMALTAIPSSMAFHKSSWSRQETQLSILSTPEEIESYPGGQNWRSFTLMLPFAVIAIGLTVWGKFHKLALLGFGLYLLSLAQAAGMSAIYEWYDGGTRTAMAASMRQEIADRKERERQEQEKKQAELDEHRRRMAAQLKRLEAEKRERQIADREASRREIYERQMAQMKIDAKQERERRRLEEEEKKKAERRKKELAAIDAQRAEERRLAELEHARRDRERQLKQAEELLVNLNASLNELLQKNDTIKAEIAECEKKIKANAAAEADLVKQLDEKKAAANSIDQAIERAKAQLERLAKAEASSAEMRQAKDVARHAAKQKALTDKDIRALSAQISTLQADTNKHDRQITRATNDLDKAIGEIEVLEAKIDDTKTKIRKLKD